VRTVAGPRDETATTTVAAGTTGTATSTTVTGTDDPELGMPPSGERIGPYTLLTEIGRGGMGRVYLAHDGKLARKVAIKFIALRGATARMRFVDEARLTARCRHPNIVVIHDIAEHDGVPYMVLEHVAGPTLATLVGAGPLRAAQVVAIATQVARALAHAHAQGIIHRDLKPANVLLDTDGTAKVADFGIARHPEAAAGTDTSGTLHYMAPEQLRGEAIDGRADLFALGVTMYQMLAGHRPLHDLPEPEVRAHVGDLDRPMPSLAEVRADLPSGLTSLVDRCLEKRVERRVGSAAEVVAALQAIAAPSQRAARWPAVTALVALVLAAGAGALLWRDRATTADLAAAASARPLARRAVAVLGFENLSGDPDTAWIATALSELLGSELAAGEALRLIPAENVARTRRELAIGRVGTLAAETLGRVRTSLHADYVVVGAYLASSDAIRVDLRVQDARTGETAAVVSETGGRDELGHVASKLATPARAALGAAPPTRPIAANTILPASREVARQYVDGLVQLRQGEYLEARNAFERVVAADSGFAPGHGGLADALASLGRDTDALAEAERAVELGMDLPEDERLRMQARVLVRRGQNKEALAIQRRRLRAHPDDVEVGLEVLGLLEVLGEREEFERMVGFVRRMPGGDDLRVGLSSARYRRRAEQPDAALAEARRVRARAEMEGARSIAAGALLIESEAQVSRGQFVAARAAGEDAMARFASLGERAEVASALRVIALADTLTGALDAAERRFRDQLELRRELGAYDFSATSTSPPSGTTAAISMASLVCSTRHAPISGTRRVGRPWRSSTCGLASWRWLEASWRRRWRTSRPCAPRVRVGAGRTGWAPRTRGSGSRWSRSMIWRVRGSTSTSGSRWAPSPSATSPPHSSRSSSSRPSGTRSRRRTCASRSRSSAGEPAMRGSRPRTWPARYSGGASTTRHGRRPTAPRRCCEAPR